MSRAFTQEEIKHILANIKQGRGLSDSEEETVLSFLQAKHSDAATLVKHLELFEKFLDVLDTKVNIRNAEHEHAMRLMDRIDALSVSPQTKEMMKKTVKILYEHYSSGKL